MKISERAQRERLRKSHGRGPRESHHFCFYIILSRWAKWRYEGGEVLAGWTEYGFTFCEIANFLGFFGMLDDFEVQVAINHYGLYNRLEKRGELYHMTKQGIDWYNSLCQKNK